MRISTAAKQSNKIPILSPSASTVILGSLAALALQGPAQASGLTEVTLRKPVQAETASTDRINVTNSVGKENAPAGAVAALPYSDPPVLVSVSLRDQQMSVYEGLNRTLRTQISSGKKGHATPTGIFSILEKRKYHESNLYSDAPMPFMQRLTWSGIALHEGKVPPYPASHGCVRIPKGTAKTVFGTTGYGTHVILADDEVTPRPVSHFRLFQPIRHTIDMASLRPVINHAGLDNSMDDASPSDLTEDADKRAAMRIYATRTSRKDKTIFMQTMLNSAGYDLGEADGIYGQNTISAVRNFQEAEGLKITGTATEETIERLRILTGTPGLADGRIYVRIRQKPVFDAEFEIKDPDKPLGTHLVLLAGLSDERADWLSVSVPSRLKKATIKDYGIDPVYADQKVNVSINTVLNRLEIPENAREFISERLAPGTSFAISDNGLGTETGKGTDFIVPVY